MKNIIGKILKVKNSGLCMGWIQRTPLAFGSGLNNSSLNCSGLISYISVLFRAIPRVEFYHFSHADGQCPILVLVQFSLTFSLIYRSKKALKPAKLKQNTNNKKTVN